MFLLCKILWKKNWWGSLQRETMAQICSEFFVSQWICEWGESRWYRRSLPCKLFYSILLQGPTLAAIRSPSRTNQLPRWESLWKRGVHYTTSAFLPCGQYGRRLCQISLLPAQSESPVTGEHCLAGHTYYTFHITGRAFSTLLSLIS